MNDIYKRLANGESSESIAAEFTAALNEAMARHAKEEEERAAKAETERLARMEAEARKAAKRQEAMYLIDDTFRYLSKFYPSIGLKEGDWDDEDVGALADLLILVLDMEALKVNRAESRKQPFVSNKDPEKVVDPFAAFFKEFGLS